MPAEHDVVDARLRASSSRRATISATSGRGDGDRLGPAEALGGLGLGVRAPQRRVLGGDAATATRSATSCGTSPVDGLGRRAGDAMRLVDASLARASSAAVTVSSSSFQETMNFSTPSFSSSAVTSS